MRTRTIKDANDARKVIDDLFGYTPEWIGAALDDLGPAALTDEALILIAQAQLDAEFGRAEARDVGL